MDVIKSRYGLNVFQTANEAVKVLLFFQIQQRLGKKFSFFWVVEGKMQLHSLKKAMKVCIDFFDDLAQVFGVMGKVDGVNINYQQLSFIVFANPGLIAFVQAFLIVQSDALFVGASPFLDVFYQGRNG